MLNRNFDYISSHMRETPEGGSGIRFGHACSKIQNKPSTLYLWEISKFNDH